jgi:hypothetical protein
MQEQVRMSLDEAGDQRGTGELDPEASSRRPDPPHRAYRLDPVPVKEHDPSALRGVGEAVPDGRGHHERAPRRIRRLGGEDRGQQGEGNDREAAEAKAHGYRESGGR